MSRTLTSPTRETDGYLDAMEQAYEMGWSDGLPVVPPTDDLVVRHLEAAGLEPDRVVAEITERDRIITAEKVAINSVMAGCRPEYLPVVVAALEAMTDPRYRFNHLASLGSPWPLIIVNGPISAKIGLNSGIYLFGPGHRPNLTIARAVSLVLRNCGGAKVEDVQRGQWGNPIRFSGCIAENEQTPWIPLHVQRGFGREESTVTVVSTYPGSPGHVRIAGERPERMLHPVCNSIANWGGAEWLRGTYTLMVGTFMVEVFVREGWSKDDVRSYVIENTKASIANLKYRGAWKKWFSNVPDEELDIQPADESTMIHLFKPHPEYDGLLLQIGAIEDRDAEILVVVAGGDAGSRMAITVPYQIANNAVTKKIRVPW